MFLFQTAGLDKNKIGEFLGKNKPYNLKILPKFFSHFIFKNQVIDAALRKVFKKMRLPKEF